jgi:flagellar FliL protein|tara:strand:+ start:301946 stop:302602 length:657 start_codon:yes stop_codon:yes gene_type:complete
MSEDLSADVDELADGEDGGEEGSGEESLGAGKKKLLIILVPVILLLGGGAAAFFTGMLDGVLGKGAATEEHGAEQGDEGHGSTDDGHGSSADDGHKAKSDDGHGSSDDGHGGSSTTGGVVFLEIPKMIVSLSSDDDQPRYLSLSVQLELESNADKSAVQDVMPRVVDQFQTFLRELRVQDLRGTKGLYRLKLELLGRVNAAAYPVEVKNILLQDMIVQ